MGNKLRRKPCDGSQCRDPAFFSPSSKPAAGADPFFKSTAGGDAPVIQKDDAPKKEEKKDPAVEGLKVTGEQLFKHEPFKVWFKKWYEPQLGLLKNELWEKASPADKAILLGFAGVNLGMLGFAFSQSPEFRKTLSDVNIGAPLGLIPYSPIEGFKYKLPDPGKTGIGFSADFTFNPYLDLLHKRFPRTSPWTGATLSLDSQYDPAGGGFSLTGGKFGLDFFGGGLSASGSIFNKGSISPYPIYGPGATIVKEFPGLPDLKTGPGYGGMLNVDFVKLYDFFHKKDKKK